MKIALSDLCLPNAGQVKLEPDTLVDYFDISSVDNISKTVTDYETYPFAEAPSRARKAVRKNSILVSTVRPNLNAVALFQTETDNIPVVSTGFCVLDCKESVNPRFVFNFCRSKAFIEDMVSQATGASYPAVSDKIVRAAKIPQYSLEQQNEITQTLDSVSSIIEARKQQLQKLDELVKARFVELFGDLKSNPMEWPVVPFTEFAKIDGNMTTDYEKYADYPHIGIDSIEKGTGALKGYRTVREDGVISGKYIFTPQHIIYSKIRPNLNKVALPDFEGLCSADAYPILPNHSNCNRVFLAIALRSEYFLEYILQFSSRTNLPKVNRKEITGFRMPLPPLKLQEQFAAFVEQTDKSKAAIQKALDEAQLLFDSLMQEYFG